MEAAPASVHRCRPWLGTFVEITASGGASLHLEAAVEAAFDAVARVHRLMSFHDPDSDVSRLNRIAGGEAVTVDPWTFQILRLACELYQRSAGVFDVTVAPVLQFLGLLPCCGQGRPASRRGAGGDPPIELLAGGRVRFRSPGIKIDLGGIAKGFAVDSAIDVLRSYGIRSALVNAGGDLAAFGEPQVVHIRNPFDPSSLLCAVTVTDRAVASSGGHLDLFNSSNVATPAVIDPRTERPASGAVGATVCARSGMIADALTKIVMAEGQAAAPLLEQYQAGALAISANKDIWITSNWEGALGLAA